ncbi:hypothetical protein [Methylorubrum salsuginis]|uniref:Uncharacterized protein n=1 Tax=Methylorubrum salsuginis TaxID=414703 RepID=A0A1I4M756_9HYPH|nr:hypothetical protein [Methylorubrum salsuginis]SFL98933.1 hypothetical protein SAMN04488125_13510 [Methylorubrum salsuginis]
MRRFLTSGIKAILAIAVLSTAAHWALRLQREPAAPALPVAAALPDPVSTGSIAPRRSASFADASVQTASADGFDQEHLAKLMAGASAAKAQKASAKR